MGIAILVMFLSFYFSKQWYSESIKTKQEIRTQIFEEMKKKQRFLRQRYSQATPIQHRFNQQMD